jgi:hypothetical protein
VLTVPDGLFGGRCSRNVTARGGKGLLEGVDVAARAVDAHAEQVGQASRVAAGGADLGKDARVEPSASSGSTRKAVPS